MAGRLCRWLRFLGYDAAGARGEADRELVARADAETRILVTRDRRLIEELRPTRSVFLRSESVAEQLRQLVEDVGLRRFEPTFERCSLCNVTIDPVPPAAVRLRVPERVAASKDKFWRCPSCRRIYWHGSHAERLRTEISRALREAVSP